ncbi:MAG: hypothetical protein HC859_01205 [Bacteroidia bacterium]|nr:hypothetical protein [Bacteroidia bacterium]
MVHILGVLVVIAAASDIAGYWLFTAKQSTVVLFNSFSIIQFVMLSAVFYSLLESSPNRKLVLGGSVFFALGFILITSLAEPFTTYQTLLWTLGGILLIVYSIAYFVHLFSTTQSSSRAGYMWINSAILFYFSLNLFLFVISSYVLTQLEPEVGLLVWNFHNINNIVKNILLGIGIGTATSNQGVAS